MDERSPSGYQFRHRRILSNASADGTECPSLSQLRRCHTDWGDACTRWEVQPLLDTCHLSDNATCGLGYHELVFRCRRYDGVSHKLILPINHGYSGGYRQMSNVEEEEIQPIDDVVLGESCNCYYSQYSSPLCTAAS